jgi:hypothetical protein
MKLVSFSTFWYLLQFLSSKVIWFSLQIFSLTLFYFFETIVNGIVFLRLFIVSIQKGDEFCSLILYPATLSKIFIRSRNFWWNLWVLLSKGLYHLQIGIIWLIFYDVGYRFVTYSLYYVDVYSFFSYLLQRFKMLCFLKCLFCINWDDHVTFPLDFVYVLYNIYWFMYTEPSLRWNKLDHAVWSF